MSKIVDEMKMNESVQDFARKMKKRMIEKYDAGLRGYDDKANKDMILANLKANVEAGDWVDVGNLAMMMEGFGK